MAHRYLGSFPCTAAGARRARALLKQFAQSVLTPRELQDFEAAMGEALANAVEHGQGSALSVSCWSEPGAIVTEIVHDGRGFLPPSRVALPPGAAPRGYGLFIMHQLLDEIEFLDDGRRLRLVKRVR